MLKQSVSSFVLFFLLSVPGAIFSQSKSLDWDIQFLNNESGESMPINKTIRMETGQHFQLAINAEEDCYCYVIIYDSQHQIYVWYYEPAKKVSEIKPKALRLTEPSGTETVYVIVSSSRQGELERLLTQFKNSSSSQNTDNLYREIVRLQDAASGLGEPATAIIPGGVSAREVTNAGVPADDKSFSTKFTGKELYVRAIGVRH